MIEVGMKRNFIGSGILMFGREDSGHIAWVLRVGNPGSREDTQVGVELVASLAAVFKVVAMTDGEKAHVTRQGHALRSMNGVPAGHGIVHGRVGDIGVGRRLACHVEMDGIVHDASALSQLVELDALYLDRQETLARDHVPAEVVPGAGGGKWCVVSVTG